MHIRIKPSLDDELTIKYPVSLLFVDKTGSSVLKILVTRGTKYLCRFSYILFHIALMRNSFCLSICEASNKSLSNQTLRL